MFKLTKWKTFYNVFQYRATEMQVPEGILFFVSPQGSGESIDTFRYRFMFQTGQLASVAIRTNTIGNKYF